MVLKFLVTRLSVGQLEQLPALAASLHCDWQAEHDLKPRLDGNTDPQSLRIEEADLPRTLQFVEVGSDHPSQLSLRGSNILCSGGRNLGSVNARGEVLPCIIWPDAWSLGNVLTHSFGEIWRGPRAQQFRKSTTGRHSSQCAECEEEPWCERCPAVSLLLEGDVRSPYPTACEHARIRRRAAATAEKVP